MAEVTGFGKLRPRLKQRPGVTSISKLGGRLGKLTKVADVMKPIKIGKKAGYL